MVLLKMSKESIFDKCLRTFATKGIQVVLEEDGGAEETATEQIADRLGIPWGEWKRKLVDNLRPGAWLVDLKRYEAL